MDTEGFTAVEKRYRPLARLMAHRLYRRTPGTVPEDDLEAAALTGLWEAWQRFTPERRVSFATFCRYRMLGAMRDWLRQADHLTHTQRRREPSHQLDSLQRLLAEERGELTVLGTLGLRGWRADRRHDALVLRCAALRRGLPWRTRIMLRLYFDHDWLMQEVGAAFSISESQVSQVFKQTFADLRDRES